MKYLPILKQRPVHSNYSTTTRSAPRFSTPDLIRIVLRHTISRGTRVERFRLTFGDDQRLVWTKVESVLGVAPHHVDPSEVITEFWYGPDFGTDQTLVWPKLCMAQALV
jgi:hypothetical protein